MIDAMNTVWSNYPHKGGRLLLMLALANYANQDGVCWPSIATLARDARLSDRQCQILLRQMHDDGDIVILLGASPHKTNLYHLNLVALKQASRGEVSSGVKKLRGEVSSSGGVKFSHPAHAQEGEKTSPEPSCINHHVKPSSSSAANAADGAADSPSEKKSKRGRSAKTQNHKPQTTEPLPPVVQLLKDRGVWAAREFAAETEALVRAYLDRVGPDHPAWVIVEDLRAGLHRVTPEPAAPPAPAADDPARPAWISADSWLGLTDAQRDLLQGAQLRDGRIEAQRETWTKTIYERWWPMAERLVAAAQEQIAV